MNLNLNDMPGSIELSSKEMALAKRLRKDLLTNLKTKKKKKHIRAR